MLCPPSPGTAPEGRCTCRCSAVVAATGFQGRRAALGFCILTDLELTLTAALSHCLGDLSGVTATIPALPPLQCVCRACVEHASRHGVCGPDFTGVVGPGLPLSRSPAAAVSLGGLHQLCRQDEDTPAGRPSSPSREQEQRCQSPWAHQQDTHGQRHLAWWLPFFKCRIWASLWPSLVHVDLEDNHTRSVARWCCLCP